MPALLSTLSNAKLVRCLAAVLVLSQVVLSIGIPFAVIPLMRYTHDKELMGKWADGTVKHVIFMIVVALIVALNVLLIVLTLMGRA